MPTLKAVRSQSEYSVLPYFGWSGSIPTNKGTIVKVVGSGFLGQNLELAGPVGATYAGIISERWSVVPQVAAVSSTGDYPLGLLMYDIRETDENGIPLRYDPEKAAQMNVTVSGQNVLVCNRGEFFYSGIAGTVVAGAPIYAATNGELTVTNPGAVAVNQLVGQALSVKDINGFCYVSFNFQK